MTDHSNATYYLFVQTADGGRSMIKSKPLTLAECMDIISKHPAKTFTLTRT